MMSMVVVTLWHMKIVFEHDATLVPLVVLKFSLMLDWMWKSTKPMDIHVGHDYRCQSQTWPPVPWQWLLINNNNKTFSGDCASGSIAIQGSGALEWWLHYREPMSCMKQSLEWIFMMHMSRVELVGAWLLDQTTSCCALLKTQTNPTIIQVTLFTPFYSMFEKLYRMRSIFWKKMHIRKGSHWYLHRSYDLYCQPRSKIAGLVGCQNFVWISKCPSFFENCDWGHSRKRRRRKKNYDWGQSRKSFI